MNLECWSEICCTRLAENTGLKKITKKSPSAHHRTTLPDHIFTTMARIDNRNETLLNSNISSRCTHNVANFGPLTAEIDWRVCGTPGNFKAFRVLASLLQRRRSSEANQTLHDVWPSPYLVHCIGLYTHFSGAFAPDGNLPGAMFTLRPSLRSPILAALLHGIRPVSVSHKLCGAVQGMELRKFLRRPPSLYSAGRPSRWAPAHILVLIFCTAS